MRPITKFLIAAYAIVFIVTWIVYPPVGFPLLLGAVSGCLVTLLAAADYYLGDD